MTSVATSWAALAIGPGSGEAPEWVHLLPTGSFSAIDGRGPWRTGDIDAVIAETRRQAGGRPIAIDYDHAIDKVGSPAPAAGWINDMEAREDGLWGKVDWTPRARDAIAGLEYRFLSPVIAYSEDGSVVAIHRAALTNNPAVRQLTALFAAEQPTLVARLAATLKLPTNTDADGVVEAVRQLVARPDADPTRFVPIGLFQQAAAAAARATRGVSEQAANLAVDEAIRTRKLLPFMRPWAVALCTADKPAFDDFVTGLGAGVTEIFSAGLPAGWTPPEQERQRTAPEIAERLGVSAEDLKRYGSRSA